MVLMFPFGNTFMDTNKLPGGNVEILATYNADRPTIERRGENDVRVVIHFGHSTIDIIGACLNKLSSEELDELVELWANPNCKREYLDVPEGLLVKRVLGPTPLNRP